MLRSRPRFQQILKILDLEGMKSLPGLAEILGIKQRTLKNHIQRLNRMGYITRTLQLVKISEEGRRALHAVHSPSPVIIPPDEERPKIVRF